VAYEDLKSLVAAIQQVFGAYPYRLWVFISNLNPMDLKSIKTAAFQVICRQYGVRELYAFGSVTTDRFTEESDVDFLVVFTSESPNGAFDQFMGLKMALEVELGRSVDLLTLKPFRNPLFQQEVDRTKVLLYAA
jgi:predicted nucleotidyltransferase